MKRQTCIFILLGFSLIFYGVLFFLVLPPVSLLKYWHAADLVIQGRLKGERLLDFSPLYLYFNVILRSLKVSQTILLCFHIMCTTLSCLFLFEILRHYFRPLIAFFGAVIFLIDRSVIVFTQGFEPEPIAILSIIVVTFLLTRHSDKAAFMGGLCFGVGIWTRPNFIPVLLVIPFWYLLHENTKVWKKKTALFLIAPIFCIAGLWIRNAMILGYLTPFVMNPGTAFFEGNNPNSWGMSSVYPPVLNQLSELYSMQPDYHHQLYRDFARQITQQSLTLPQVNSYWINHAVNFLIDHPAHSIKLVAIKIFHVFHSFLWHDLATSYLTATALQQRRIPTVPFGLLSAFAICGILVMLRQWRKYLIFYAVFFSQFFFMLAIYVSARQRASILFLFVFFCCGAVQFLSENRKRLILLAAILPIFVVLQQRTDFMLEEEHLWHNVLMSSVNNREAYRLRAEGKLPEASEKAAAALALTPWLVDSKRPANIHFETGYLPAAIDSVSASDSSSKMDVAVLLLKNERPAQARKLFGELLTSGYHLKRDDQQSSNLHYYLAQCDISEGKRENAIQQLETGIAESPGDPWILSSLFALTSGPEYRKQLSRYFDEIDAQYFLGKAYLETEQPRKAADSFQFVIKMIPAFRKAYIYMAVALAKSGSVDEAATAYRKAIQMAPDPVFYEGEILSLFKSLAEARNTAMAHYSYGVVLRQFGYYTEALQEQRTAKALGLTDPQIDLENSMLRKAIESIRSANPRTGPQ